MKQIMLKQLIIITVAILIGATVQAEESRIVVISHGQASDPFWAVVKNGVDAAAEDMGVNVEYRAPDTFDMPRMAQLIDAAVASQPNGLVVSIPDADALGDSIRSAIAAGIPVISMAHQTGSRKGVDDYLGVFDYNVEQMARSLSEVGGAPNKS